ncbi:MAG TPA: LysR substrate-binding domain-containing protein [Burkholderiales bacterium]|nr:LysR substrate-binding domain-containing protein [Burkholderiales bacterium]
MTLTELRYIVALARERHFGRAAEKCFVSQPTLSVAVRKLEDELGVTLFERGGAEVTVTPVGSRIVEQAQRVLEEAATIKNIAIEGKDELATPLRFATIYTIGPYLMPLLIPLLHKRAPRMPLIIQENYTARLSELLKTGEVDVAVLSLPFSEPGIITQAVYDEPFRVLVPATHPWARKTRIPAADLCRENLLLLSSGNCFREQVLQTCAGIERATNDGIQHSLEGSSLETIRHMVASGVGITVVPAAAAEARTAENRLTAVKPFTAPVPSRRVALAWRRSFPRSRAVELVREAILACKLPGVTMLPNAEPSAVIAA